ncbi:hypothetical protein [Pseudidiomarina terrestris]|uniref:hypothetical protein n=1 Tax=Pseudidiomarina terrestris TaxID=2820060 RepID=UPI00264C6C0D|nr:hypothetical protein [Pseudidiomarina sp. 1ASP75-5]MDN7136387.1 hypothetical protein [Pseudidiomarina sp. 1ASP75-5]
MSLNGQQLESVKNFIFWVSLIGLFVVIGFISVFVIQSSRLGWHFSENPDAYLNFGLLIGALLTPIIALSSVLLLWMTLKVQMEELRKSNESLQKTVESSESLVKQEKDLFELRLLQQNLLSNSDYISSLNSEMFAISDESYDPVTGTFNGRESFEVLKQFNALFDPKGDSKRFSEALQFDHNGKLKRHLKSIRSFGIDLIRYHECGGSLRHIQELLQPLMQATEPFYKHTMNLMRMAKTHKLEHLITQLASLHEKILIAIQQSDKRDFEVLRP